MNRTTKMYAIQEASGFLHDFYRNPYTTALCGKGKVLEVAVSELEKDKATPESWWAWWDMAPPAGSCPEFCFVYRTPDLVRMCFPYDLSLYEKNGKGLLLPVSITVLREVPDNDPLYTKPHATKLGHRPASM